MCRSGVPGEIDILAGDDNAVITKGAGVDEELVGASGSFGQSMDA